MKRLIIGIIVLSLLLGMGVAVSTLFRHAHGPTAVLLADGAEASLAGNWDRAISLARQAQDRWEKYWRFTAALADHSPMDQIDGLFSKLEVYGKQKNGELFPALCAQLSELTATIADSHHFRWWTVL